MHLTSTRQSHFSGALATRVASPSEWQLNAARGACDSHFTFFLLSSDVISLRSAEQRTVILTFFLPHGSFDEIVVIDVTDVDVCTNDFGVMRKMDPDVRSRIGNMKIDDRPEFRFQLRQYSHDFTPDESLVVQFPPVLKRTFEGCKAGSICHVQPFTGDQLRQICNFGTDIYLIIEFGHLRLRLRASRPTPS